MKNKPILFIPFILVYKAVTLIIRGIGLFVRNLWLGLIWLIKKICWLIYKIIELILLAIRTVVLGFYTTIKFISTMIYNFVKYVLIGLYSVLRYAYKGFKFLSYLVYRTVSYFFEGIVTVFIFIAYLYNVTNEWFIKTRERQRREAELNKKIKEERRKREEFLKKQKEEKEKLERLALEEDKKKDKLEKSKAKERNTYVNENVKLEKKKFADYINDFLKLLADIPKRLKEYTTKKYNNLTFVKDAKNKEEIHREALLINFEGDDAEKSDKKVVFEYVAKSPDGKLVKSYFEAFSKVEVHSFLLSEGYEVYSIKTSKWIQFMYGSAGVSHFKMKTKDLIFFLTQLSTYLKSGITLVEALRILSHQYKKRAYQKMFKSLIYDLTMGDNFSDALNKRGSVFPKLLINMVKASEMTGSLPEALDDMEVYYTQADKTRKQMITAMMYPSLIFVISIAVITFIMVYVIPRFVSIYEAIDPNSIPAFTLFILHLSEYLKKNLLIIILIAILVIMVFIYLYKNVPLFRTLVQWILMHIPVVNNIIIYNEVTMFTKTFASLLKHNVFITDSMEILNKMTNNEVFKMIILDTITNLAKGEKISTAFKDHWAIPLPAYEMIVTGERTGQLAEMMQKVSDYYQELHANAVGRLKTFLEPVLIIFLTGVVGVIVLSIVIPMFSMYSAIG